jgi:tight adherence protein B
MNPLLVFVIALLIVVAFLLFGESRREQKLLVQRAQAQSVRFAQPIDEIEPTIIAPEAPRRSVLTRATTWLGFADVQLTSRRISLVLLVPFAGLVGAAAAWQATVFFGTPGLLAGVVAGGLILRGAYQWELGRNREEVFRQIPDAVGLMVRAVRAGLPIGEAVRSVAREMPMPTRSEFQRVLAEVGIGVPLDRALWSIHERTGLREYAFLSVVIGLQAQTGGSLAEALDNLGNIVRQRVAMAGKARALASQARASAIILVALPPLSGTFIAFVQPGYAETLFGDPRGLKLLGIAVAMLLLGILVIRGMLRSANND